MQSKVLVVIKLQANLAGVFKVPYSVTKSKLQIMHKQK